MSPIVKQKKNYCISVQYIGFLCIFVLGKYAIMIFSTELIKGTLKTIVLKLLSDTDKMYGYEITQHVKEMTADKVQITEGALYPTLHALEKEGLVTTQTEYIGKRMRKYYKISKTGKTRASEKVNELADFMETMSVLMNIKPKTA